ncbi:ABC transporter substrate-binding protein [Nostoc edaphicum]|uniref:ABC transporter substrate-binding protein n=1 Tax=Nostoc edaphicum TaxID=264686 RepID=UPI002AD4490D|nr:ABC transporter substrate-binding protein [Nostoc edaphicum]
MRSPNVSPERPYTCFFYQTTSGKIIEINYHYILIIASNDNHLNNQRLRGTSKVEQVESVGSYNSPNIEKILKLKPDLIISGSDLKGIYKQLSYIAPTVVLNTPYPPPNWIDTFEELAQILGKEEVSKQLIDKYWQRVEKLKQALGVGAASPNENRRNTIKVSIANTSSESGIWSYG